MRVAIPTMSSRRARSTRSQCMCRRLDALHVDSRPMNLSFRARFTTRSGRTHARRRTHADARARAHPPRNRFIRSFCSFVFRVCAFFFVAFHEFRGFSREIAALPQFPPRVTTSAVQMPCNRDPLDGQR